MTKNELAKTSYNSVYLVRALAQHAPKFWPFPFYVLVVQYSNMQIYKTKAHKLSGSDFHEVHQKAFGLYTEIKKKSKRRAYIRSAFFDNEKIFLDLYWHHLFEKQNWRDRVRRLRYYGCALELIKNSRYNPNVTKNPNVPNEVLYRFYGTSAENEFFCTQIKENLKKRQKFLISVFPAEGPIFY